MSVFGFTPNQYLAGKIVAVATASALLAGCGLFASKEESKLAERNLTRPCPPFHVAANTDHLTQFRPGPGHDLTDVRFAVDLAQAKGVCEFQGNTAKLTLTLGFDVARGPANAGNSADFSYFVAIPSYYPKPQAKAVFPLRAIFPENASKVRVVDDNITIDLPLAPDQDAAKIDVYVGVQLDQSQLEFNRAHQEK